MHSRILSFIIACLFVVLISATSSWGASTAVASTLEYRVKAAFLINFAKFVVWPERAFSSPTSPIVFVIAGDDPFGSAFDSFQGQTIGNRPIVIRRLKNIADVPVCHVLFIPQTAAYDRSIYAQLRKSGLTAILTVTDNEDRSEAGDGAMITLFVQNEQVAFTINNALARKSGLGISVKLLSLADTVVN